MKENGLREHRWYALLRIVAMVLVVTLVLPLVSPSVMGVVSVMAESNPALAKIYGLLGDNAGEPETYVDYCELANIAIGKRSYEEALGHLETARSLAEKEDPAILAEMYLKSASVYVITAQLDKAQQALDEAIRLDGSSAQARLLRAQLAIDRGDVTGAITDLESYLGTVPGDNATRLTLAQLLEGIGHYAKAKEHYETLYEAQAADESHLLNALRCQFLAGEYEEALKAFDQYITDRKSDSPYLSIAHFLRAACLMQLGRFDEAAKGFASAQQHGYDEATCREQMMLCYFEGEAYQLAVEEGEKLIELGVSASTTAAFYQRMGAALVQLERHEDALEYLSKAMESSPELAGSAYYRGVALLSLKRYEEAVADFTMSIEQGFLPQFCYYNRGVCYVQLLDYEKAIDDMGMTLSSGEDAALIEAAKDILWQLAAYYENAQAAGSAE